MNVTKLLKPANGLKVRHPNGGRHLDPDGETIEITAYWIRRLGAGDVVEAAPAKPAAKAPQAAAEGKAADSGHKKRGE